MASNYHSDGGTVDYTNGGSETIASGAPLAIGGLLAVALVDIAPGATGAAAIDGVWHLPKASGAVSQGAAVDLDVSTGKVGKVGTPASGDLVGCAVAMETVASGAATVAVKLNVSGAEVTA